MENAIRELLRSIYRFYRTFMVMVSKPSRSYDYLFNPDSKLTRFFTESRLFFILTSFMFAFIIKNIDLFIDPPQHNKGLNISNATSHLGTFIRSIQEVTLWESIYSTLPILLITAVEVPLLALLFKKRNRSVFINFFLYLTSFQKLSFFFVVVLLSLLGVATSANLLISETFTVFAVLTMLAAIIYITILPFVVVSKPMKDYLHAKGGRGKYILVCILLPINFVAFIVLEVVHNKGKAQNVEMLYEGNTISGANFKIVRSGKQFKILSDIAFRWNGQRTAYALRQNALVYEIYDEKINIMQSSPFRLDFGIEDGPRVSGPLIPLEPNQLVSVTLSSIVSRDQLRMLDTLYRSNLISHENNGYKAYFMHYSLEGYLEYEQVIFAHGQGGETIALVADTLD